MWPFFSFIYFVNCFVLTAIAANPYTVSDGIAINLPSFSRLIDLLRFFIVGLQYLNSNSFFNYLLCYLIKI